MLERFSRWFLVGLLLTAAAPAVAQDDNDDSDSADTETSTASSNPAVEALEEKKKIAELEAAIADAEKEKVEAEKAKLAAKLPTTEASGVTGSVSFGVGSGYFAEMLAYQSLQEAAQKIADQIGAPAGAVNCPSGPRIVVVADADLAAQAQLWEVANTRIAEAQARLDALEAKYAAGLPAQLESLALGLTAASSILGAAADIASFFRSDLAVTARTVNVTSTALSAAVAARLTALHCQIRLPGASLTKSKLIVSIEDLLKTRRDLQSKRQELLESVAKDLQEFSELQNELELARAALERLENEEPPDKSAIAEKEKEIQSLRQAILPKSLVKTRWERAAAEIDAAAQATDALVAALLERVEGKPSAVEAVAAIDVLKSEPGASVLRLETSSQGGEMHVSKSVWATRVTYVGGVAISYLLTDHAGFVSKAGVVAAPLAKSVQAKEASAKLTLP